jgi:hypothetical protein
MAFRTQPHRPLDYRLITTWERGRDYLELRPVLVCRKVAAEHLGLRLLEELCLRAGRRRLGPLDGLRWERRVESASHMRAVCRRRRSLPLSLAIAARVSIVVAPRALAAVSTGASRMSTKRS